MGGRGAASGTSNVGNVYGSQYNGLFSSGRIKFVTKKTRQSEPLMETMTKGRVYVETGGKDLLRIISFDKKNKRNMVLERDKRTGEWHKHLGYFHAEKGKEQHLALNERDKKRIAKVRRLWHNYLNKA